jgi:UDP-N-acetylmuramoyl-L-alanyl-D-glutamate--2,6-diaminopimelate ligase
MLNEIQLSQILAVKLPSLQISDIHWKTQDSDKNSLLFYRIPADEKSQKLFTERIDKAQYAWLILNSDHPSRPMNSTVIKEEDWPRLQKELLDHLYTMPSLKLIALTGTNGKTTTTDLVLQLGELCGKKGLSVGTLGVRENHKTILDFGLTSPSLIDLRKYLNLYGKNKDFCVLEASSHALTQNRLYGLNFDMGGWLSFSQDHLDYHQTMEEYFSAKMLLTNYLNADAKIFVPSTQEDLYSKIARTTQKVAKAARIEKKLPLFFTTSFNRSNLEVAVAIIEKVFALTVPDVFEKIIPPDGRFFIKPYKSNFIVVDFAHTPDALDNICQGIRESFPNHKLKVLFGCGGDRDRTKRPMMGKIAETWGSEVYVTSDNPRSEDPGQIIDDILKGMSSKNIHRIIERPKAVEQAFSELKENEILLLAGKGHEDYILIHGVKHPYSDIGEVEKFLARKNA